MSVIEPGRFGSGHAVRRIEDPTLVSGRGQFADDISLPGQTYAAFARSTCPHAVLKSVDVGSARAMPGVLAVYTGADLVAAGVKAMPGPAGFTRPDGSAAAFEGEGGFEIALGGRVSLRAVAQLSDTSYDLEPDPTGTYVATGATDRFVTAHASVRAEF
jgi:CO/xanthine dehydrogenase Mo-binding subunit